MNFAPTTPYFPARDKFSLPPWLDVYLVLEDDGTEVDEEEYFQVQTLPGINTSRYRNVRSKHFQVETSLGKNILRYKHYYLYKIPGTNTLR